MLKRAGHTEAGVDLAQLAGLYPAGVICEIQNPDGSMARLPELIEYAKTHKLKIISIADLISYRLQHERFVYRETVTELPSQFGHFPGDVILDICYSLKIESTQHSELRSGACADEPNSENVE